mmetsp:Transcript_525/g.2047  ORF Transcript_525/g.2047 Transcript_525/m.2047 type:complete len:258 (+) Transcript_525:1468-2241(+)
MKAGNAGGGSSGFRPGESTGRCFGGRFCGVLLLLVEEELSSFFFTTVAVLSSGARSSEEATTSADGTTSSTATASVVVVCCSASLGTGRARRRRFGLACGRCVGARKSRLKRKYSSGVALASRANVSSLTVHTRASPRLARGSGADASPEARIACRSDAKTGTDRRRADGLSSSSSGSEAASDDDDDVTRRRSSSSSAWAGRPPEEVAPASWVLVVVVPSAAELVLLPPRWSCRKAARGSSHSRRGYEKYAGKRTTS